MWVNLAKERWQTWDWVRKWDVLNMSQSQNPQIYHRTFNRRGAEIKREQG